MLSFSKLCFSMNLSSSQFCPVKFKVAIKKNVSKCAI